MKIFAFSIREDEIPYIKSWQKDHSDVEVGFTEKPLTPDTAIEATGSENIVVYQQLDYSSEIFEALAEVGVKTLSLRNAGVDNVDFESAGKFGFQFSNVPLYSPQAIAEQSVTMLQRLLRRSKELDTKVAKGDLRWTPTIGREMRVQTVAVIGTGNIGRLAIKILQGFGARVIAYDKYYHPDIERQKLYVETLEDIFSQATAILLHTPSVPELYHMINATSIAKMQDDVAIVNQSRGDLVDIDAIIAGLDSGKIFGFATDVLEKEVGIFNEDFTDKPLPTCIADLIARENVILTPHTAFYTETAVRNMIILAFDAAKTFAERGIPKTLVRY